MALDGLVLHAIVHELQACVGGRINKIHQPTENDVIMHIRAQGQNVKLLLSANPTYPRVQITEQSSLNPMDAPMFCMLLRKHCESGVIEAVEQIGMERVIRMQIRHRDELGDMSTKQIIVEIMGRHSNIILLDPATETILDGIHHVTPAISSYRIVMPGSKYVTPPEQDKQNPLEANASSFLNAIQQDPGEEESTDKPEQKLVTAFSGLSPLIAKEIVFRSRQGGNNEQEIDSAALWTAFHDVMAAIRQHRYEPVIVEQEGTGKLFFAMTPLTHIAGISTTYATPSDCLEHFYGDKAERDTVKQRVADLLRFLHNEANKNVKKLEKLQETVDDSKDADKYRILGELLTASLHLIKRGDREVEIINYYDEDQALIKIKLDPLLNPSENAQRYFKKYTKMKNSTAIVEEQIAQTHQEITYLNSLLQQLSVASLTDIEEIRDELMEQGYVRDRNKKQRKKKKKDKPALACYLSSEGVPIYVGKNNTQNEYLTNRLASSMDTWLHTKDIPGSHVVIRSDSFSETTLMEAAQLAAYFSQAKQSSQVPVDYTAIKHVHKPNGSKPGFVIYVNQKTLFVTPDENMIKQMNVTIK
ncbi:NFACT family protein [Paenibacillus alginolyticus]|uniref:Rqc2 homolog RqcH n=1 Tax=Paenibacillus alginolyticus TaxID=59839 RepID=A0ABT4GJT3_9BACL|nr:NFACT RNA binding domain-containing protein [Paenibacillus alginolyticus]MCY9668019.1 NFACT family protein [Paenibacillus alginolyticus]MCY9696303.1 NFACT family protein [Paenibacillus alginolyticus]MEC0142578.1 NFACT RNA binding domain-containing protein [Paenibacillus alginolyticus]